MTTATCSNNPSAGPHQSIPPHQTCKPSLGSLLAGVQRILCVSWDTNNNKWRAVSRGTHPEYHATEEDAARTRSEYLKDGIDPVKHREASTSQFMGVSWAKHSNKWRATSKGKHLGHHTTEEAAARAYHNYLKDGSVPEPAVRGGWGASHFKGVTWDKNHNKWRVQFKRKYLGVHTTEEDAARAYSKYLEDGIDPVMQRRTSQFTGVSWAKDNNKWKAQCQGKYLGCHTTEEAAARVYSMYLEDGVVPGPPTFSSQFTGVSWDKSTNKWKAKCKDTYLGFHTTEEGAARVYNKYLKDGIDPVKRRAASTSQFTGVCWDRNKWVAKCKGTRLGRHTTEEAAAQAYNVEAERVGRPLNVIPPAGAAGAGAGPGTGVGAV